MMAFSAGTAYKADIYRNLHLTIPPKMKFFCKRKAMVILLATLICSVVFFGWRMARDPNDRRPTEPIRHWQLLGGR